MDDWIQNLLNCVSHDEEMEEIERGRTSEWIKIFDVQEEINGIERRCGTWMYLIPVENLPSIFQSSEWDLKSDDAYPGFISSSTTTNGYEYRFPCMVRDEMRTIQPFLYYREFYGVHPPFVQLAEEFILLFNLAYSSEEKAYYSYTEDGLKEKAVVFETSTNLKIRKDYLVRYLAAKQMAAVIEFDSCRSFENYKLERENRKFMQEQFRKEKSSEKFIYSQWGFFNSLCSGTRLQGKFILRPLPVEECGIWPYKDQKEDISFLVGLNEAGKKEYVSPFSNERNYKHATFDISVLDRYRQDPTKYKFNEHSISCGQLWGVPISFSSLTTISICVEDIKKYLPESEWGYWKAHECLSRDSRKIENNIRDEIDCWLSSCYPVDMFKELYNKVNNEWEHEAGWPLFVPLHKDDRYIFDTLTLPLNNHQSEFDDAILHLTKIMVDSLNVKNITTQLRNLSQDISLEQKGKSIELLSMLLDKLYELEENREENIELKKGIQDLKNLQNLRSSSTAHKKGNRYESLMKTMKDGNSTKQEIFLEILYNCMRLLNQIYRLTPLYSYLAVPENHSK